MSGWLPLMFAVLATAFGVAAVGVARTRRRAPRGTPGDDDRTQADRRHIVVIGSNPTDRSRLCRCLARAGFRASAAEASASPSALARLQPDAIVLSDDGPQGDILAQLDRLKNTEDTAGIPVVVVGPEHWLDTEAPGRLRALCLGASATVPFERGPESLARHLTEVLGLSSSQGPTTQTPAKHTEQACVSSDTGPS